MARALAATAKAKLTGNIVVGHPQRLWNMDAQGIDYQAIKPYASRPVAVV